MFNPSQHATFCPWKDVSGASYYKGHDRDASGWYPKNAHYAVISRRGSGSYEMKCTDEAQAMLIVNRVNELLANRP